MFVRARCAAAILAGVALLAGCSGSGSSPRTLPSLDASTGSPSASPSPTSTASELAAASAVVRDFFRTANGPTTIDAAAHLRSITASSCKCRQVANSMTTLATRHQHYFGGVTLIDVLPTLDGPNSADVIVEYSYATGGVMDAAGRVISTVAGRRHTKDDFQLFRVRNRWIISNILSVSAGSP